MVLFAGGGIDPRGPVAGRIGRTRPISTRWRPGDSFAVNYARTGGDLQARADALNTYFSRYQPGGTPYRNPGLQPGDERPLISWYQAAGMNRGISDPMFEGRPFLGGYPDDYVSATRVRQPYASDNLSLGYFADQRRPFTTLAYGQPIYREGDQALYAGKMRLTPDQIRQWQAFFQLNGFKTGISGAWGEFEMNAMKIFMGMANSIPGGGMTVDTLRNRVMAEIEAGRLEAGTLAQMGGDSGLGGGGGGPRAPYTETTVEREVTQFSPDEGLAMITQLVAKEVGRQPTEAEVKAYIKQLNARFRADPTVITTVVTTNPLTGQVDTRRTVDETGVSPEGQAMRFAEEGVDPEERFQYQAARYLDAIMDELGM